MPVKNVHQFENIEIIRFSFFLFRFVFCCLHAIAGDFHSRNLNTFTSLWLSCYHWCRLFLMSRTCRHNTSDRMQCFRINRKSHVVFLLVLFLFYSGLFGPKTVVMFSYMSVSGAKIFHFHHSSICFFIFRSSISPCVAPRMWCLS